MTRLLTDVYKRQALLSVALWCAAAVPPSHLWMRLCSGTLGLGGGMALLAADALIAAATSRSRAAALNLLHLMFPVGVLVNPPLSAEPLALAAAATATLALAFAAWTPMALPAPAPREGGTAPVPLLALLLFLYAICEAGTWIWLARYMDAARVLDRATAWLVLSYSLPLGLIVGRIGVSRILVNVAPLPVARIASFALAFTTALMLLARSPSASWIGGFSVGVAMAAILPTTLAMSWDALPRLPATGMAIVLAGGWIGLAASSPLIAGIADRSSLPVAMLVLPVVSLAMGALTIAARR